MSSAGSTKEPLASESAHADATGRKQIVSNVLWSWGAQMIYIVAGFIMPRLIDRHLGKEILGIWDFGWSIVSYFSLASFGVTSSINRFVALHRAEGDLAGINQSVSSVICIMSLVATLMIALTIGAVLVVPKVMSDRIGNHQNEVQCVIFFLGLSTAVQAACSTFAGVLTGCHHWKVHNGLHAGGYAMTVLGMVTILTLGFGIRTLAMVYFLSESIPWMVRIRLAYWACPGLSVRFKNADWPTARSMLNFGGKSFIPDIADLLVNQTVSVLIFGTLGPPALALYSRPRSLVLQVRTLVFKMAAVLVPSASSLQKLGHHQSIRDLTIKATRFAAFLTLPLTTLFVISGGTVLEIWMGPRYKEHLLFAILAAGYASFIIQIPTLNILVALNLHGRTALANLFGSICTAVAVAVVVRVFHRGLPAVAAAATLPMAFVYAIYVPIYTCRCLEIPLRRYLLKGMAEPLLAMAPFAACLIAVRFVFPDNPYLKLAVGGGVGSIYLGIYYWRKVLPQSLKTLVRSRLAG
jgi:O-antigen/teichoic acid export membrane protein